MKSRLLGLSAGVFALFASDRGVLWRDPGPIAAMDLAGGPGGAAKAPAPPFTFVSEDQGGTTPKITVKDSKGVEWVVKFGEEVKSENFASRIAWAAGYFAEPTYFVPQGKIEGVTELRRASAFVDNGSFRNARFELRDEALYASKSRWSLTDPALKGSRELGGLKTLIVLLSNWDVKPENLAVVQSNGQQRFAITDWGGSMGRPGDLTGQTKWDCERYTADTKHLIEGVENGFVNFNYAGKQRHEVRREIKVEDVNWLMSRLGKLSDAQIDAALKASGATPEEATCFGKAFRSRLGQLMTVANSAPNNESVTRTRREVTIIRKTQ